MKTYAPMCGDNVSSVVQAIVNIANITNEAVATEFNGVALVVRPGDDCNDIVDCFFAATNLRTRSSDEQSWTGSRKSRAFMIVIEKMIARYQNSHRGNTDEEMFKLYERAKRVHYAKNSAQLTEAIRSI